MGIRKTKIVCTLGPATGTDKVLEQMFRAGMNVGRLNFSHGTHEMHCAMAERFRRVRDRLGIPAALLLDTKGPEIRLKNFKNGRITLACGDRFVMTSREVEGSEHEVTVTFAPLASQMKPGMTILADDGKVAFRVTDTTDTDVICEVTSGGALSDHKSINIPNVHIDMPYISEADRSDLIFGTELGVDYVAASFVRCREDVEQVRTLLREHGGERIRIISKIENMEGVRNFDGILEASDGIMVARGDMGVEVPFEQLPGIQKMMIGKCCGSGKPAITATQMLESMIHSSMPTRAEISDVANAVFDGTSAVMLSGESAMGDHPALVISTMAKIAEQAEQDASRIHAPGTKVHFQSSADDITNAVSDAAVILAKDIGAGAVIAVTYGGTTARRVSKFRPAQRIIGVTPDEKTYHQLSLSWGVCPVLGQPQTDTDSLFAHAVHCARAAGLVKSGERVVITAGVPLQESGNTNILKVQVV